MLGVLVVGAQKVATFNAASSGSLTTIGGSRDSLIDVLDLLGQKVGNESNLGKNVSSLVFNSSIIFENVSFRYSDEGPDVLSEISFSIEKGDILGIVGPTGCGKSTLLDLIMGLSTPTSGSIYIDDVKIGKDSLKNWRSRTSHVSQDIFISDKSMLENVAFGVLRSEIDKDKVSQSCKDALVDDFWNLFDINCPLGESGNKMSGGQKQRVGIAKGSLSQPRCSYIG